MRLGLGVDGHDRVVRVDDVEEVVSLDVVLALAGEGQVVRRGHCW